MFFPWHGTRHSQSGKVIAKLTLKDKGAEHEEPKEDNLDKEAADNDVLSCSQFAFGDNPRSYRIPDISIRNSIA
jgi:hypothetical protein